MEAAMVNTSSTQVLGPNSYDNLQYGAIRTEIDYLTKILMQFQAVSVTSIPIIIGTGDKFNLDFVVFSGPIITIVFGLMLLFIQNSIMRAGEYIRTILEPRLVRKKEEEELGWEEWLEKLPRNRIAEKFFAWSAHIAFCLYYIAGTYLAYNRFLTRFGSDLAVLSLGIYGGLFVVCLFILVKNLRTNSQAD